MTNILDYLKWRGDITLDYDDFNEVDNLCLSQMSYTLIEGYFDDINDTKTIKEVSDLYFKDHTLKEIKASKSFVGQAPLVLKAMGESKRFKDKKIHHVVSILNKDNTEQFCGFQIDLSNNLTYLVFRGTDDSLIGWKEDFNTSCKIIEAQEKAKYYVNNYLSPFKKYIYGGHSKGGMLAVYAAISSSKLIRNNIINIYSNDGCGINEELIDLSILKEFKDRFIKIIPSFDVIGTIFDEEQYKHIVIKSNAKLIMEHDAMSWIVDVNKFERANLDDKSIVIKEGLKQFIKEVSIKDREDFLKDVFEAFDELNINNITELYNLGPSAFIKATKRIIEMNKKSKDVATKLITIFTSDFVDYSEKEIKDNINKAYEFVSFKFNKIKK